ncbi:MAG: ribosome-binding factor A [Flavobacteriales bacterium]|jgi:ribosome-binding factor A
MAREFKRADRISDAMLKCVADILRQEVRDPRISMANVNSVDVTRDLSYAKVYVTFVGIDSEQEIDESISALNAASGFVRSRVAKELNLRTTPRVQFVFDRVAVRGQELSSLIDKTIAADRSRSEDE